MGKITVLAWMVLLVAPLGWGSEAQVDFAKVTVENRNGRDWCVLDAQVTMDMTATPEAISAVILDFASYPTLDSRVKEIRAEEVSGAILVTEKLVVSVLTVQTVNQFTLRFIRPELSEGTSPVRYSWTQEKADGTIDSLEGSWVLDFRGTSSAPLTRVVYHSHSAVPMNVFGQDALIRLFLGSAYKDFVEAVAKKAGSK